jgi:hypothetical protein
MILELTLIGIVAVVTWCVASEGAWGAALTLLSVIIAGLLATCLFEVTANFLQENITDSYQWQHRWDVIAMVGLFAAFVFGLRMATERIVPTNIEIHGIVFDVTRWGCGLLSGLVTMAFLLAALHTAPLPPGFLGFTPEPQRRAGPVGQAAPDLRWLGFVHYMTETAFGKGTAGSVFDGDVATFPGGVTEILPSFPIRYATRRERYYSSAAASTTSTAAPAGPGPGVRRPTGRPSGPTY